MLKVYQKLKHFKRSCKNAAYFQSTSSTADYTVKLPTVINAYADVRLTKNGFVTGKLSIKS